MNPATSRVGNNETHTAGMGALRIIFFFACAVLLAFGLDLAINRGLRQIEVSKFGVLNKLTAGRINADILISGSSRALNHYDPRIIRNVTLSSAYNIGMNASQIDFQLTILKTYLKRNKKPKLLIQNLDMFSFETTKAGEFYDPGCIMPYLGEQEIYDFLKPIEPSVWKWRHIPLYGYSVEDMRFTWAWGLLRLVGIEGAEDYYFGFNPRYQKWTGDFERFRQNVGEGTEYSIEPQGVAALHEILELCRREKIAVILVFSPEYFEIQSLQKNRSQVINRFIATAQEFNVPFWDYSSSYISTNRDFFYNSQHLNAEGATAFSKDLSQKIVAAGFMQ